MIKEGNVVNGIVSQIDRAASAIQSLLEDAVRTIQLYERFIVSLADMDENGELVSQDVRDQANELLQIIAKDCGDTDGSAFFAKNIRRWPKYKKRADPNWGWIIPPVSSEGFGDK